MQRITIHEAACQLLRYVRLPHEPIQNPVNKLNTVQTTQNDCELDHDTLPLHRRHTVR